MAVRISTAQDTGLVRAWAACLLLAVGCGESAAGGDEERANAALPVHTVVYGGDVTAARRINTALFEPGSAAKLFGDVEPKLKAADLAVVNLEGVVSQGGLFTDKSEPMPYMYRAHPRIVDVLVKAGVDIATVGNNHTADYGREAFVEMLDRLAKAGIDYTGGGVSLADARTPAYRVLGDTVVAVIGADMTAVESSLARPDAAGTFGFALEMKDSDVDAIARSLIEVLKEARRHAHVVLFTPHWGRNWKTKPSAPIRKLAEKLIRAGYDGILGHSAHLFHGMELIDGKPVLYDAGNLLLDYTGGDDSQRDILYELEVTRAGVKRVKAHALWLERNRSSLAKGKERDKILETLRKRSEDLGAEVAVENGAASLACRPGKIEGPAGAPALPRRTSPPEVRNAPSHAVLDALPAEATPVDIRYEGGIRLIGYRLLVDELTAPWGAEVIALYFTADEQPKKSYFVHVEGRGTDRKTGEPKKAMAGHLPGDWVLPSTEWPPGKVIQDFTMMRLDLKAEGTVSFFAGLIDKDMLTPVSTDRELDGGKLLHLGDAEYKEGARGVFEVLRSQPGTPWSK